MIYFIAFLCKCLPISNFIILNLIYFSLNVKKNLTNLTTYNISTLVTDFIYFDKDNFPFNSYKRPATFNIKLKIVHLQLIEMHNLVKINLDILLYYI